MKKRLLSLLLSLCLLLPFCSTMPLAALAADAGDYVIYQFDHRLSLNLVLNNEGVIGQCEGKFDPIDLTVYDYPADPSRVALQIDLYMNGDTQFQNYMTTNRLNGGIELTSSGGCDVEEKSARPGSVLAFEQGVWKRVLVPLSSFGADFGGTFNPRKLNYFRMYLVDEATGAYAGATGTIKICNIMLVDTAVPEDERPSLADMPIGDGTFTADPPVFRNMNVPSVYNNGTAVYAGYNLKEYLAEHPEINPVDSHGLPDYSGVVNSLLDALNAAGGGALFIPSGHWPFRHEINMAEGTTLIGEWISPEQNPDAVGTILDVYCGKGEENGTPFITMNLHSVVENLSFWYPEQTVDTFTAYPPTIDLSGYTFARNLTMYNPYFAIQSKRMSGCPNAWNIYGTPLSIGADFDLVVDIARIEELHFSADYWMNSGLPGAPTSKAAVDALESQLYNYAIGITLRRIDWSYVTHSDIRGYNIGLMFAQSTDNSWPNGQCVGLNFTNCKYGHFVYGSSNAGESLLDITMKNCEYGIYLADNSEGHGAVQYFNADIQATQYAVFQDHSYVKLSLTASTIRNGRVVAENGNSIFINNQFRTAAPQIELLHGTVSGILLGNTNSAGKEIKYENPGLCTVSYDAAAVDMNMYTPLTREEAAAWTVGPDTKEYRMPTDLDKTGATDVTEALQAHLTAVGALGGGTVFLVPGKYRIDGSLAVPTGVELRGAGDYSSIPKALNTVLNVNTPIEEGHDQYTSTATITLSENSGLRGLIFNYPHQNETYRIINEDLNYYEFDFVSFPFTVRGAGADVYLKYVSVRNGWNGVDFKTNRCDRHFVDYLAGHFMNRGIVIGGGSEGGFIRNYQFNYNAILNPYNNNWSGFGGEPSTEALRQAFHQPMQAQFNNNCVALTLGNVNDQVVYNCFNYASFIGVHLVEENGEAPNARVFGHGVDYGTVSVRADAAEQVEFTNLQVTAFNQSGNDDNRWAVDQSVTPIYDIWVTDTFEGELNITNLSEWAPNPNAGVRVDSGRLNIYNAQFAHTGTHLFELNGDGVLNIVGFNTTRNDNPVLIDEHAKNLFITAGYYTTEPVYPQDIGAFRHVHLRKTRHSVPKNVNFDPNSSLVIAESFDSYDFANETTYKTDVPSLTTLRRGAVRLRLNASQFTQSLMTGEERYEEKPFTLTGGEDDAIYRMEWRFNISEMRGSQYSEVSLWLTNQDVRTDLQFTVTKNGAVTLKDGKPFTTISFGTDYRVAVEVDARRANAKTATIFLMDDENKVIARSATTEMPAAFQGDSAVTGFRFGAIADPGEAPDTETDMTIDYFYVTRSAESTFGGGATGDVNGDNKVDSTDARLTLQYAVGKIKADAINIAVADVNGDNKVDSTDARLILQYAVGKIKNF